MPKKERAVVRQLFVYCSEKEICLEQMEEWFSEFGFFGFYRIQIIGRTKNGLRIRMIGFPVLQRNGEVLYWDTDY